MKHVFNNLTDSLRLRVLRCLDVEIWQFLYRQQTDKLIALPLLHMHACTRGIISRKYAPDTGVPSVLMSKNHPLHAEAINSEVAGTL